MITCRTPGIAHRYSASAHSLRGLVVPRVSGISMDVAVPEDTGQDPALEVEQCACPPEYRGPSCQVSPCPTHLSSQPPPRWCSGSFSFSSPTPPSPPRPSGGPDPEQALRKSLWLCPGL